MIPFQKIKDNYIAIQFTTPKELELLVDKLREKNLKFGTWNSDLNEIKYLGFQYFKSYDRFLTIDQSLTIHKHPFVCCGRLNNAAIYKLQDIEWEEPQQKTHNALQKIAIQAIQRNIELDSNILTEEWESGDDYFMEHFGCTVAEAEELLNCDFNLQDIWKEDFERE